LTAKTGNFVTSGQTGNFVTLNDIDIFVTKDETGSFGSSVNTDALKSDILSSVSCLYSDTGYFLAPNDSKYCSFASRAITNSSSQQVYLCNNNSANLFKLEVGDYVTYSAVVNMVGSAASSYANFKIEGSARRYPLAGGGQTVTCTKLIDSGSKQIFDTSLSSYDIAIEADNNTNSLKLKVFGDSANTQHWFAKLDIVKNNFFNPSQLVLPSTLYFSGNASNYNWFSSENWYTNSSLTTGAISFPQSGTTAVICGNKGPLIDLNHPYWSTPVLINALNLTDASGVCIYASPNNPTGFSGIISGTASFYGSGYLI
jgi:hypothetical protein